jgi:hypothetical protein
VVGMGAKSVDLAKPTMSAVLRKVRRFVAPGISNPAPGPEEPKLFTWVFEGGVPQNIPDDKNVFELTGIVLEKSCL